MDLVPVLIVAYNRFDSFRAVFDRVIASGTEKIYLSIDGPKLNRKDDKLNIELILNYAKSFCDKRVIQFKLNNNNQGCRNNMIKSIDWFFENEERGIILEDDCLPEREFFIFMAKMLEQFNLNSKIFTISGSNFIPTAFTYTEEYLVSKFTNVWGWGTWRDRWKLYIKFLDIYSSESIYTILCSSLDTISSRKHFFNMLKASNSGILDTWDYNLAFTAFTHDLRNVHSARKIINNVGFDENATHTFRKPSWLQEYDGPKITKKSIFYDMDTELIFFRYRLINNFYILRLSKNYFFKKAAKVYFRLRNIDNQHGS